MIRCLTVAASLAAAIGGSPAPAQRPSPGALIEAQTKAMSAFAWTEGQWRGEAVTQTPTGEHRVAHTERSGPLLGGSIRLIEGHSYRADGSTGFNALAVLSFDPASNLYRMHSYAEGQAGDFVITPTPTGYVWSIPAGPMTIRYTAVHRGNTWTEDGERIIPGKPAVPIFHMNLRRVGPSKWPADGAVRPH